MTQRKSKPASETLKFLPLGGSGEIGMNLNLYEYEGQWLMLDLGITFGRDLGIDIIMPDVSFIEERRKDLAGIVLTHGHEDHIGAVPYLWDRFRCPLYATPFTAVLVRNKLQEAGLLGKAKVIEVPVGGQTTVGKFGVEFVTLTHSIPEPNAVVISTPAGKVVHTGDWKLDPGPMVGAATNEARLTQLGDEGVLALVCDSTNVFVEGRTESEAEVRNSLIELIGRQTGRVAIGLFASNVARLETCALAAKAHNRKAALAGRSLQRMHEAAKATGYLKGIPDFISDDEARKLPRDQVLYICTGSQGEPRAALTKISEQNHPRVRLEAGDSVIFSSRQIPGNELSINDLQNRFRRLGVSVIRDGEEFTHASGHPAREELKDMYKMVRPHVLVPVHGEHHHLEEQARLGLECQIPHAVVPHNGSMIELTAETPEIIEVVETGRLCLDGNRIVPLMSSHIRERGKMMRSGVAAVTVPMDRSGEILEPIISFAGLVHDAEEENKLQEAVLKEIAGFLRQAKPEDLKSEGKIREIIRTGVRRATNALCGLKPAVMIHLIEV